MVEEDFLRCIRQNKMISRGDRVLVGVSGGPDSVALLHLLNSHKNKLHIRLAAAHLNHKIRGLDADSDETFVRGLAGRMGIEYIAGEFDVPLFAKKNRLSLEDAARRARYEFFERTAMKVKANRIALGHTADDNVETFIMRLIRGSGPRGLEGIPAVRGRIIRPLIGIRKADLEHYCRANHLEPKIDRTNYDKTFFRNRIRHELLPLLETYNPKIGSAVLRLIDIVNRDHEFMKKEAVKLSKDIISSNDDRVVIDKQKYLKLDPALRSEMIRTAVERAKGSLQDVSYINIYDIFDNENKANAEVYIAGIHVNIERNAIVFSRAVGRKKKKQYHYPLAVPEKVDIAENHLMIETSLMKSNKLKSLKQGDPNIAYVDYNKLARPIVVRSWMPGDRFRPLGMKGTKKVQDIFVDAKIDVDDKTGIPIISDRKSIVWIAGYRIADRVKVDRDTTEIMKIKCSRAEK